MTDRPDQPQDPGRRRFFRQFAGEVATSVGSVLGAAQVLQQQSAEAARELLAGELPEEAAPARIGRLDGIAHDTSSDRVRRRGATVSTG